MKITPARFKGFLNDLSFQTKSVLVFGPDASLLSFKTSQILETLSQGEAFETVRYATPPDSLDSLLKEDQPSLFETAVKKKVFVISNVKDKFLKLLEAASPHMDENTFFILEGLGLPTSSKLVKFHEAEKGCFCLGVYEQSAVERKELIGKYVKQHALTIASPELVILSAILPADPALIASEIQKLSLYLGSEEGERVVTQDAIEVCIEPEVSEHIDQLIHQVCMGDRDKLLKAYEALKRDGEEDMKILRSLTHHLLRLLQVAAKIQSGEPREAALASLRPRLFFKTQERFKVHLGRWSVKGLYRGLETVKEIEMRLKTTQDNLEGHISRGFLRLSTFSGR